MSVRGICRADDVFSLLRRSLNAEFSSMTPCKALKIID